GRHVRADRSHEPPVAPRLVERGGDERTGQAATGVLAEDLGVGERDDRVVAGVLTKARQLPVDRDLEPAPLGYVCHRDAVVRACHSAPSRAAPPMMPPCDVSGPTNGYVVAAASKTEAKKPRPSSPAPYSDSTACSGCGISPTTLPRSLATPAMSRIEPFGL